MLNKEIIKHFKTLRSQIDYGIFTPIQIAAIAALTGPQEDVKKQCEEYGLNYELVEKQTDTTDLMEGIYIKVENEEEVIDRFKYVRSSFLNTILDSETHWVKRPIIPTVSPLIFSITFLFLSL